MNEYSTCVGGVDLGDRTSIACVYDPGVVVDWAWMYEDSARTTRTQTSTMTQ